MPRSMVGPTAAVARLVRSLARCARGVALVLATLMLVSGCKSFYPVDIHTAKGLAVVEPGEFVRVTTLGGEEREFAVTDVEPQRIAGRSASYTSAQIATLERHEFDIGRSLALGTGVYVAVALVATAALVSAWGGSIL